MTHSHKRNDPRVDLRVSVQVEQESRLQQFYSRNLSSGGIFVEVEGNPPAIGSKLKLSFEVPNLQQTIEVEAQVQHHHAFEAMDSKMKKTTTKTGIGLRFLNLKEQDRELLHKYVTGKDVHVSN